MKIFIDSATIEEIQEAFQAGFLDGVTTNPSLIKKAIGGLKEKGQNVDMAGYIKKILKTAKGTPVSLEVTASDHEGMVRQGKKIYEMFNPVAKNVNVKVPVNPTFEGEKQKEFDGCKTIKQLADVGIPVNCTLIFTPEQALMAAKAGATYVSPFAGRVDDYIRKNAGMTFEKKTYFPAYGMVEDEGVLNDGGIVSGVDLVQECVEILGTYGFKTEVIAASIRNARQARECAEVGAQIATLPLYVIRDLMDHFKTREGMGAFAKDTIPEYADLLK